MGQLQIHGRIQTIVAEEKRPHIRLDPLLFLLEVSTRLEDGDRVEQAQKVYFRKLLLTVYCEVLTICEIFQTGLILFEELV